MRRFAFDPVLDRVRFYVATIDNQVMEAARVNEAELLDLNTQEQLFNQGQDASGRSLPGPYSPAYAAYKAAIGLPSDRVTLFLTGDFHSSFRATFTPTTVRVDATDPKAKTLEKLWGRDIYGLNKENLQEFARYVRETLQQDFRRTILK